MYKYYHSILQYIICTRVIQLQTEKRNAIFVFQALPLHLVIFHLFYFLIVLFYFFILSVYDNARYQYVPSIIICTLQVDEILSNTLSLSVPLIRFHVSSLIFLSF